MCENCANYKAMSLGRHGCKDTRIISVLSNIETHETDEEGFYDGIDKWHDYGMEVLQRGGSSKLKEIMGNDFCIGFISDIENTLDRMGL